MKLSTGYITTPTKAEAKEIATVLLEEGLVACANIFPGVESYFSWDGEIQKEKEIVIMIKTRQKHEDKIIRIVKEIHSYEVPCVTFTSIDYGNKEYLKWIDQVT